MILKIPIRIPMKGRGLSIRVWVRVQTVVCCDLLDMHREPDVPIVTYCRGLDSLKSNLGALSYQSCMKVIHFVAVYCCYYSSYYCNDN